MISIDVGRMSGLSWLMLRTFCLCWVLAGSFVLGQSAELPEKDSFHLFLLVGQSNMAGRGTLDELAAIPHPRVMMLTKDRTWDLATDPLHFDKPGIVGVGLGREFAEAVAEANPKIVVGLIPCAVGGSPISSWQPGEYYPPTKSHPWDDAIARAQAALKEGTLKGILWHQGESDSKPELAPAYEAALKDLIERFRSTLNAPEVPFVAGQMGIFAERPWSEAKQEVDRVHRELPKSVARTGFASAEGLKHKGDEIHFDTASFRELGRRYYAAWSELAAGSEK